MYIFLVAEILSESIFKNAGGHKIMGSHLFK